MAKKKYEDEKEKKNKKMLLLLLLLFFIVISFYLGTQYGNEERRRYSNSKDLLDVIYDIPTEPVDKDEENKDDKNNDNWFWNWFKPKPRPEDEKDFKVIDSEGTWKASTSLKLFNNEVYGDLQIIAPTVNGSFMFTVSNYNTFAIIYNIKFEEINPDGVNMKYRIKKDGIYVLGNESTWVTAGELILNGNTINSKRINNFIVEWVWEESPNDTSVGESGITYDLKSIINAEQKEM